MRFHELHEGPIDFKQEFEYTRDNISPRKPPNKIVFDGVKVFFIDDITREEVISIMTSVMKQLKKYKIEFLARKTAIYFTRRNYDAGFSSSLRNIVQIDFRQSRDELIRTVFHELGHKLQGNLTHRNFIARAKFKKNPNWLVTGYAHENSNEAFCELFSYYVADYDLPKDAEAWMRTVIMNYAKSHT